jgi:hypothetical protein
MPRRARPAAPAFDAITIEGTLIAPPMLAKIAASQADGQSDASYRIPKGLTLRDEIARYFRIGQSLFEDFAKIDSASTAKTRTFVERLLSDVFGFGEFAFAPAIPREHGGRMLSVTSQALSGRAPILVVRSSNDLDHAAPELTVEGHRRSPALALQDWLNTSDDALWGFCCNGERLRLVRANASLTRPAYIEADLRQIFEANGFADFAALWLLIHASRFGAAGAPTTDCALELWRETASKEGIAARDRLRDGVEAALIALGNGFLNENPKLRERVVKGELALADFFGQLLRLVYRLIFLAVAEDRELLHAPDATSAARRLYAEGYSLAALRAQAIRRAAWDRHADRWQGLQIVFLALARGEKRLGLPGLGGLFLPETTRDLDAAQLPNSAVMEAIYRLAWLRDGSALTPVNWRDMQTEELGSVYESLLELTPRIADDGHVFSFAEGAEAQGHARKTTGSYYTPDSLVQALLDSALDPVLDRVEGQSEKPVDALLALRVIDPACGSGHFLLAAARRVASRVARLRGSGVAAANDYRHALRDVARQCLYGVDRNPMAVELTKVALWIETIEPGKPLGFLDANIGCGDALIGVLDLEALRRGVPDEAYKPLTGDDRETARHFAARNRAEKSGQGALEFGGGHGRLPPPPPLADAFRTLRALPEDSVDEIAEKERRVRAAEADPKRWRWRVAADLYVAAFFTPKTGGVPQNRNSVTIPTTGHVWAELSGQQLYGPLIGRAQDFAREARAFHWPLEFPEAFAAGGFDVVLGNPPWERIKLQEQEFFASRDAEIAEAPNAAARGGLIAALKATAPGSRERMLYGKFESAKRLAEAASVFVRIPAEHRGRFPLTGRGDVNTYALFAELFSRLAGPKGRAGVIVPTGIATADTTKYFFGNLVEKRRLISIFSFFEIRQWFLSTDDRNPFCLMTIGQQLSDTEFAFSIEDLAELANPNRRFTLSPVQIAAINPNTKTAPIFRSRTDADLTAKIYTRVPVLIDEAIGRGGNPWGVSFARLFDMSNDSGLFRTAAQLRAAGFERAGVNWVVHGLSPRQRTLELIRGRDASTLDLDSGSARAAERYVPLYEAKMFQQFDHRFGDARSLTERPVNAPWPRPTSVEIESPSFELTPWYWVPEREVAERLAAKNWTRGWLMGWRDITNATAERTVIAAAFPRAGVGNNLPLMLFGDSVTPHYLSALIGCLSSLTADFVARHKVGGTHLNFFIFQQLAVLAPSSYGEVDLAFIVPRVLELTFTSHSLAPFARDLGYDGPPFAWSEDRRALLRAELDAFYARAYGLTRDELRYILDPADVRGPDYPSETFRVLKTNEIACYGEFRTARLVLDAWDRMERGELT